MKTKTDETEATPTADTVSVTVKRPRGYAGLRRRLLRAIKVGYKGPTPAVRQAGYALRDGLPIRKSSMQKLAAALDSFEGGKLALSPVGHTNNGDESVDPELRALEFLLNLNLTARRRIIDYVSARMVDTE